MEAVPQAQPYRQRVIADRPVEPAIHAAVKAFGDGDMRRSELRGSDRAHSARSFRPAGAVTDEHGVDRTVEAVGQAGQDPGVDEEAGRELVGEDDPHPLGAHRLAGAPIRAAIRVATERPSSRWWRSASVGVPHAGQPSTPNATISRSPGSSRRNASARPPTGE